MILQIQFDLGPELAIVRALRVQPEDRRCVRLARAVNGQPDPVTHGDILGLTGAPDIALLDLMLHQHAAVSVDHPHDAGRGDLKCLVVRAVLLRLFRHQPDIWHRAKGRRLEGAIGLAEIDHLLVDARVGAFGHHGLGVLQLAVRAPHLAGASNHCGHGSIDDNITRHMQVGNSLDRIHHRQFRALRVAGLDVLLNLLSLRARQMGNIVIHTAEAVVGVDAEFLEQLCVLLEDLFVEDLDRVSKHDRVRHFHHGGFHMQRPHHPGVLGIVHALFKKFLQCSAAHKHGVQYFTRL